MSTEKKSDSAEADKAAQQALEGTDRISNDKKPTRSPTNQGAVQRAVEDLDTGLSVEPSK